jgi:hypothetical protein
MRQTHEPFPSEKEKGRTQSIQPSAMVVAQEPLNACSARSENHPWFPDRLVRFNKFVKKFLAAHMGRRGCHGAGRRKSVNANPDHRPEVAIRKQ